jgi:hypothetical protein
MRKISATLSGVIDLCSPKHATPRFKASLNPLSGLIRVDVIIGQFGRHPNAIKEIDHVDQ